MPMALAPKNPPPHLSPVFAEKLEPRLREVLPDCTSSERQRRVAAALDFLSCCARPEAPSLAPSPKIDAIWHEMIMFTADYRKLCHDMGVAFIDHEPIQGDIVDAPTVGQTVTFMRECGIEPDPDLWNVNEPAKCCSGHVSF